MRHSMSTEKARKLATHLREEAGSNLRSVVYFDGLEHEIVYVRDDVDDRYSEDDIASVVESLLAESVRREQLEDLYVHGDLNCTVQAFDDALELHFPHDDLSGTAIAFDPEAGSELNELIADILEMTMAEESIPSEMLEADSD